MTSVDLLCGMLFIFAHFTGPSVQYSSSERHGNKVYHFDRQKRTFDDAQEYCIENGHRLVRIESQSEQDWFIGKLDEKQIPFPVWLDVVQHGETYTWSDGMGILWSNWDTYSRSQCTGACHAYLSEATYQHRHGYRQDVAKGTWSVKSTAEVYSVVCEEPLPVSAPGSSFQLSNGQQSDADTLRANYGLKMYYMPLQYMTRTEAKEYCDLQHDHVVRVSNFAEQSWLKTNMAEGSRFWLGAHIPESANGMNQSVQWSNGDNVTWTNWNDHEPSCVSSCSVIIDKNDKWITKSYDSTMTLKTICERDLLKSINDRINEIRICPH
ncbi:Secretory phospholipase A2 receptor [Halotydeus destructor]|nr:Secretory phospholipase A2 receptor [Halotydeus destructor]